MSLISQIRAYLETYYPQLIETTDDNGDFYFEHLCTFADFPSLIAVTVDKHVHTILVQVMIGKFFHDYESDEEVYVRINELNKDYKFVSFSEIDGALNMEYHLLAHDRQETVPPILEYLLLLTAAANDITGANEQFHFDLDDM